MSVRPETGMKKCLKCHEQKSVDDFYKNKTTTASGYKYYFKSECKACHRKRTLNHSKKEDVKKRRRDRLPIHMRPSTKKKTWTDIKNRLVKRNRELRQTSKHHNVKNRLYRRLHHALKGKAKTSSTFKLVGCSPKELVVWLESQFTDEMNWENIHIDHMIPCIQFDLSKAEAQKQCFHYTNLQPLIARENLSKSSKNLYDMKWVSDEWYINSNNGVYRSRQIQKLNTI